jgi:hypothetical protein
MIAHAESRVDLQECVCAGRPLPPLPEGSSDRVEDARFYCMQCAPLWIEGDSIPNLDVGAASPGELRVVPDFKCIGGYGWAGAGMGVSQQLAAFSADSRRFIRCDSDCEILDVASGCQIATTSKQRQSIDGSPISEDPASPIS